jgi:hypothetical protein
MPIKNVPARVILYDIHVKTCCLNALKSKSSMDRVE